MPDAEVIKHSVTKEDFTKKAGKAGAVLNFFIPYMPFSTGLPLEPPPFWSHKRDEVLRATVFYDSLWSDSVYIACTKMSSLGWKIRTTSWVHAKALQSLLLEANENMSWANFINLHLQDFLLTDNGAFIEIIRASSGAGSKIIGLMPLDSLRCTRTGDPEKPIIYQDKKGHFHEMERHQVICLSDMTFPGQNYYGVGLSAATRAYRAIYRLSAIDRYVGEKITGQRPLALHFVNNISQDQVDTAVRNARDIASQEGYTTYMSSVVIANIDPTVQPQVATIDLAGLPDKFDPKEERRICMIAYADAIGLDPQDIDPELLASKAIGTGAQSRVIDDKASGKGLIAWRKQFSHAINEWVAPNVTTFAFHENDYRDRLQQAQLSGQLTTAAVAKVQAGIITAEMAKQILVDQGELPREFVDEDLTVVQQLNDDDDPQLVAAVEAEAPKIRKNLEKRAEDEIKKQQELFASQAQPQDESEGIPGNTASPEMQGLESEQREKGLSQSDLDAYMRIRRERFSPVPVRG